MAASYNMTLFLIRVKLWGAWHHWCRRRCFRLNTGSPSGMSAVPSWEEREGTWEEVSQQGWQEGRCATVLNPWQRGLLAQRDHLPLWVLCQFYTVVCIIPYFIGRGSIHPQRLLGVYIYRFSGHDFDFLPFVQFFKEWMRQVGPAMRPNLAKMAPFASLKKQSKHYFQLI